MSLEARLKTVLNTICVAGGKPNVVMCGAFNKQAFSSFTGRSTPIEQATSRRIFASVDYYDSDFDKLSVTPNRFMRGRDVLVLEMTTRSASSCRSIGWSRGTKSPPVACSTTPARKPFLNLNGGFGTLLFRRL
jgi:hypothetical protein